MLNFRLIRHLWLFLAVAEEQNFGRAAKRLGMSQPPLTEQIKALETGLGVRLFERHAKGAKLTREGAAILPAVRTFADQVSRLELAVKEAIAGQSGTFTIAAIASVLLDDLPSLLPQIRVRHPSVTIAVKEIDSAEAEAALLLRNVDVAIGRLDGRLGPPLAMVPIASERLGAAMPADHPLACRDTIDLAALADEVFVSFCRDVSPMYFDRLIHHCMMHGFSPRILHEVRSVTSQLAFVACGQGVALLPTSYRRLAPRNVVLLPLTEGIEVVTAAMAWNTDFENPLVAEIMALLRKARLGESSGNSGLITTP